jgi:hypothetical protein
MLTEKKMSCGLMLFCLIAGWNYAALSQDSISFHLDGFIEFDHISYYLDKPDGIINNRNQGLFQLDLGFDYTDKARVFLSTEFREDFSDKSRNRIYPKEYYLDLFFKNLDLRLGKQRFYWGRSDGINVTNNLNPIDLSDFLDTEDEEIGVLSASALYYFRNCKVQGVFVPVFTPAILPGMSSVWFPAYPGEIPNPYIPGQSVYLSYTFVPPGSPEKNLSSAQGALKVDASIRGWDFSASYYSGYSHIPETISTEIPVAADSVKVTVNAIQVPWIVIGADFAKSLGPFGLRGEAAYFITKGAESEEAESEADFIRFCTGADYIAFPGHSNASLQIIIEWMQELVPSGFQYPVTSLNHLFQEAILARLEYNYRNFLNISFQTIYDIKSTGYYFQPKISYDIIDGLNIILLTDFLGGNGEGFFSVYSDNDRIQFKIKYFF